jgi:hypothetical protein
MTKQQMAGGIINTADPIWRAGDQPTAWDRIRELRCRTTVAPILG